MGEPKTEYIVSLDRFEGPLDLLHQLIEKRKLQINTISLAKVTADYMTHIRNQSIVPIDEVAQFIHTASILVLIKSKSLLPILEYTKEEESDIAALESRIQILDLVRKRAVPALAGWRECSFSVRLSEDRKKKVFRPDPSCSIETVAMSARTATRSFLFLSEPPKKSVHKTIRIEEVVEKVMSAVTARVTVSFREMSEKTEKREMIVSFLAILELVRKDLLSAQQQGRFDDIIITRGGEAGAEVKNMQYT